ncbi:MAG TPA: hypothetical protein VG621_02560 [Candidatus Paceibacterota bacterium]|nr:hypothetical protein [Candidatus Paceibacterota bacterium]
MKSFISLLFITISVVVFFVFIRPLYESASVTHQEVAAEKENLATASQLVQSRDALMQTYQSIAPADLQNIKTLLPDSVDNIRLIIQINALATQHGLSLLRNVDYQTQDDQGSTSQTSADGSVPAFQNPQAPQTPYGQFTISFETTGQYKDFLSFLSDLEQNLRLVDVVSVEFEPAPTSTTGQQATPELYKVTLRTYWLKQ